MSRCRFEAFRTLAFGSISGTYAQVGTPFPNPLRIFRIVNNTNGDMIFSVDAIQDQFFVPAGGFLLYDVEANKEPANTLQVDSNTVLYVKQSTAPSFGAVYVEGVSALN